MIYLSPELFVPFRFFSCFGLTSFPFCSVTTVSPGVVEAQAIRRSLQRSESGINRSESSQDSESESAQLRIALEQSRTDFQSQSLSHFDQAVANSLKDLDEGRVDAAKTESLRESAEQTIVQAALRQSEEELIERQMLEAQGIQLAHPQTQSSIEEQQLKQAMAASLYQNVSPRSIDFEHSLIMNQMYRQDRKLPTS